MQTILAMALSLLSVPLNSSTATDVAKATGIDQSTADKIVEYRNQIGQIQNIESLRALSLAEPTLDKIRKNVHFDLSIPARPQQKYSSVAQVLKQFDHEPNIREVQTMAMSYSKTNPELVASWLASVKRAYALPKLNVQYEKEMDQSTRYDYIASGSDLTSQEDYAQLENDDKIVVKLEWRLDKLIMSSEQIRIINEAQKTVKLREKLLDEVTRLYFDRRRLQVETLLNPSNSLKDRIESTLREQEMRANLDALTGGAFSSAVNN